MTIGLDVAQTCAERAGCAWHADALARALVAEGAPLGHRFELYHHFGDWINLDTSRGTTIDHPSVTAPLLDASPAAARKFWRDIESGEPLPAKPDVVLSFSYHAPKLHHSKLIYTVHDLAFWTQPEFATDDTRLLCQRELLQSLSRAAGFLFVSDFTRREFEQLLPHWLEQTKRPHALSGGASRFPFADSARLYTADTPWLIVGSVEPRKNHSGALDAYEIYLERSSQRRPLVLAGGRGWKSDAVHARIEQLAARDVAIRYLGYVPDADLAEHYRTSFALLAPSWHEGFGLPLVEAMSAGIPVLASDRGSLPEIGIEAARYISPDNPEGLAAAMLALEADPANYARRAQSALMRAQSFTWPAIARNVLTFLQTFPANHANPRE